MCEIGPRVFSELKLIGECAAWEALFLRSVGEKFWQQFSLQKHQVAPQSVLVAHCRDGKCLQAHDNCKRWARHSLHQLICFSQTHAEYPHYTDTCMVHGSLSNWQQTIDLWGRD